AAVFLSLPLPFPAPTIGFAMPLTGPLLSSPHEIPRAPPAPSMRRPPPSPLPPLGTKPFVGSPPPPPPDGGSAAARDGGTPEGDTAPVPSAAPPPVAARVVACASA
ncbi:unnamed protein product, partial [Ectocarpus sp. 12 AP-2014]